MRVVSTFISPSSILFSIKCKLDGTDTEYLVLAKTNKIEIFALQPEGVKYQCSLDIWGVVSSLNAVPNLKANGAFSSLLVTTESPDPLAIAFEYVQGETENPFLREMYHISLHLPFSRVMEDFEGAVVHPSGALAVVATYVGKLRVLVFHKNPTKMAKEFDCILTQLNVLSICFLPVSDPNIYVLGILHRDHTDTIRLIAREVNLDVQDLVDGSSFFSEAEISEEYAVALLPVPASSEGPSSVLVLGGQKILFFEVGSKRRDKGKGKGKGKERAPRGSLSARASTGTSETEPSPEPKASVDWLMSDLSAFEPVDEDGSRVLLGDKYGRLCLLSLMRTGGEISMRIDHLGETSCAMTITYLNAGVIFVGSHFGDSQVVRIVLSTDGYESPQLQILNTFTNVAPIMDAILVNQGSGQSQIITCSGAHNSGSIRIIHSGIDLQESAVIESVPYVKSIWTLRSTYESQYDSILGISSLQSTSFFSLASSNTGKLEELGQDDYAGFSNEYTLALCNMATVVSKETGQVLYEDSHYVVQVTRSAVLLINMSTGLRDAIWDGGSEIVSASVNATQIAIALQNDTLMVLMVKDGDLVQLRSHKFPQRQICSVSIRPYDSSLPFSNYIALSFYDSHTVTIVQTADLTNVVLPPFSMPHLPVSVLLCQFGQDAPGKRRASGYSKNQPSELLVACGDGSIYAYSLTFAEGRASITDQKVIHLGSTRPAFLYSIQTHLGNTPGQECVLASGTVPMVIYYSNGRLKHSPLIRKGITTACSINTRELPSSVVFAVNGDMDGKVINTSLIIGQVKELRKLHIRKVTFGLDNPLRITHHPELRLLCVGCQRSQPHRVGQYPLESSSFKFVDDTTFEQLYHFPCDDDEEATASRTLSLTFGEDASAERKSYVVVGTQYYRSGETEARQGRIILFEARNLSNPERVGTRQEASGEGKIGLACSTKVKGCVFAVAEVAGRLFAAINESIYVFQVRPLEQQETISTGTIGVQLVEVAKWTHNYIVGNMIARGDRIYIGDTVNSLSVVQWDETTQSLSSVARDYTPLWPAAIEAVENDAILGCDNDCNLFVYRINAAERRLEQAGNYYLGETVNKFVTGTLTTLSESTVRSEQIFATSTGRIGVISEFDEQLSLKMSALQRNLGHFINGPGGIKHSRWRSPKNVKGASDLTGESTGFLDGDFLEKFLEFENNSTEVTKAIGGSTAAERLDMTFSEIVRTLERLQSIH